MPDSFVSIPPDQYQAMLNNYSSIVEKTNQQLSLWFNPYAVMIASLGAMFTIGAIVVTVIIWRNSNEQKKQFKNWFTQQQSIIDGNNIKIEETSRKLTDLVIEFEKYIKEGDRKNKEIDGMLKIVKDTKKIVDLGKRPVQDYGVTFSSPLTVQPRTFTIGKNVAICSNCGKTFEYNNSATDSMVYRIILRTVNCTHCFFPNNVS
ncbi:MAG: hypothetical protein NTX72_05490 [Candidatus Uhrbacteria bacterium]|nr:hypothetical protein [Candidatus Uhrbacteria bacterium]